MSWILRWRGTPASYNDEELELVRSLVARAEAGEVAAAAAEWDVIHAVKVDLDGRLVELPDVPRTRPCLSPTMCGIRGCTGLCVWKPASESVAGELFHRVESVEELARRRDA